MPVTPPPARQNQLQHANSHWTRLVSGEAHGSAEPVAVLVRPERPGEQGQVHAINAAAFGRSDEAAIPDRIRGSDRWIEGGSLVAVDESDAIVGHLLLSEGDLIAADGAQRRIWMVGPVAVLPALQRRGIGSVLMRSAIALAKERGQPVLVLLGHSTYYPRFGFESARSIGIDPPEPWSDASWMALRLPSWTPELRGVAHFAPAFGD
jgi:putative acetyltransferase